MATTTELEIKRLRQDAHEIAQQAEAIINEFTGKDIPDEKMTEANELYDRLEGIERQIKLLERQAITDQRQKEAANHIDFKGGREFERDGGRPSDNDNDDEGLTMFKSFGHQLQAVARAAINPYAFYAEHPKQARALGGVKALAGTKALGMNEGVASEGGVLVRTDFSSELLTKTYEAARIVDRMRSLPLSPGANSLKINAIDETSRANGSRWGGIQAYWLSEAGTKSATKPKFRQLLLDLKKLIGLCYATDELLADAAALEAVIMQGFEDEFSFKLDDAAYEGDGAGKPQGFMLNPALITVAKETGQAAATIVPENIVKMWARMWAPSRRNAVWYINQDIEPQLFLMSLAIGTGGVPLYMPPGALSQAPYGTLLGRPVIPIEFAETLGTTGDIMLCDPSQNIRIDKGGMQTASSIHVQFVTDEAAFRFVLRIDFQSAWNAALTPFKGTNTLSPYIVLATRS